MPNQDFAIYAVKAVQPFEEDSSYWIPSLYEELKRGRARFGWGWRDGLDVNILREKIAAHGWDTLDKKQKETWSKASFLLEVNEHDYMIYINMPEYGQCTVVRVTAGGYSYSGVWDKKERGDFRHVLPSQFIGSFDRNDSIVAPYLSARLKLQGSHWHIYAEDEFRELLSVLAGKGKGRSAEQRLHSELADILRTAAESIRRNFPNKNLEGLVASIFEHVPGVRNVRKGPDFDGADVVIQFESGIPGLARTDTCAVQVKAYEGSMGYERAIKDIEKAFASNPEYTCGLIVSTALDLTPEFEKKLEELRQDSGKQIGLLLGRDLALALIKYSGVGEERGSAASV